MFRSTSALPSLFLLLPSLATASAAEPDAWRVTYRLEVPHVERFARDMAVIVCAREAVPRVLSGNNPLAHCPARGMVRIGNRLSFEIACPGRRNDGARAHAQFVAAPDRLDGRIRMVMGGKNMTYVEVQSWRRIGACGQFARQ